jgi:ABC-type transport system substrate-binding protein
MAQYDKGSRIQLKRHDGYWEKDAQGRPLPYLDGIDFPIISSPDAMDNAFVNGQLDGGARGREHLLTQARVDQIKNALGDKVQFIKIGFVSADLIINTLKPGPFQDVRVRQAVGLWLDRAAYGLVIGGLTYPQTLMNPKNPFTSPDFTTWPGWNPATREQDKAMAKQLMADAGYGAGFETTLLGRNDAQQNAVFFQGQLDGLGIKATLNMKDTAGVTQAAQARDYVLYSNAAPNPLIPEATESLLNVASKAPNGGLGAAHEDPKVADYYVQLSAATDVATRTQIWRALEKYLLVESVYLIPVDAQYRTIAYRSYVQGLFAPPENQYQNLDFATVWLDK